MSVKVNEYASAGREYAGMFHEDVTTEGLYEEDVEHLEVLSQKLEVLLEREDQRKYFTWVMALHGEKGLPEVSPPTQMGLAILGDLLTSKGLRLEYLLEEYPELGRAYTIVARPINRQVVRRVLKSYGEEK